MNIKSRIAELNIPDLLSYGGTTARTKEEFEAKKEIIKDLLQKEEYGYLPKKPNSVRVEIIDKPAPFAAGKATKTKYMLHADFDGKDAAFVFYSVIPNTDKKLPTFVHINFSDSIPDKYQPAEEIIDRGYAVFTVFYQDISTDNGDFSTGIAPVVGTDRSTDMAAPGKIAMWSWGIMRIIDYIETLPFYNPDALAVIGHSRLGKTTLLTAAFDERVKFACVNDSGTSGDALSRGTVGESIEAITDRFPFWFCPTYKKYANNENSLPFDQHFLLSLVAPRTILTGTAKEDLWADPTSQFLSHVLAKEAYELYGVPGLIFGEEVPTAPCRLHEGNCGYHTRLGTHYLSREDWNIYMDYIDANINK